MACAGASSWAAFELGGRFGVWWPLALAVPLMAFFLVSEATRTHRRARRRARTASAWQRGMRRGPRSPRDD